MIDLQIKRSLVKYLANGIFFTFFGPSVFWLAYPLGPIMSIIVSDSVVHLLRFYSFKAFVFRRKAGFSVTPLGYLLSLLPLLAIRLLIIHSLYYSYDRNSLTILMAVISITLGFVFSASIFKVRKTNHDE